MLWKARALFRDDSGVFALLQYITVHASKVKYAPTWVAPCRVGSAGALCWFPSLKDRIKDHETNIYRNPRRNGTGRRGRG